MSGNGSNQQIAAMSDTATKERDENRDGIILNWINIELKMLNNSKSNLE